MKAPPAPADSAPRAEARTRNWIGTNPSSPSGAEFVPPPARFVAGLLDDLCAFAAREDLPEFALAGIAHAQFETIHPYADGNGRLGRCLIHFILKRRGFAPRWVPPVSLVVARRPSVYVGGLTAYRADDVDEWVLTFAEAAHDDAAAAQRVAGRIAAAQQGRLAQAGTPRTGSAARSKEQHRRRAARRARQRVRRCAMRRPRRRRAGARDTAAVRLSGAASSP